VEWLQTSFLFLKLQKLSVSITDYSRNISCINPSLQGKERQYVLVCAVEWHALFKRLAAARQVQGDLAVAFSGMVVNKKKLASTL
jgi:hypothetical protein